MRYFSVLVLLCSLAAFSQTTTTPQPKAVKSRALIACESERDQFQKWSLEDAAMRDVADAQIKKLSEQNAQLQKQYTAAMTVLGVLNLEIRGEQPTEALTKQLREIPASDDALSLGNQVEQQVRDLSLHDSTTVDKYNTLMADYRNYVKATDASIARLSGGVYQQQLQQQQQQQRLNNAIAFYNMMPKYTPPQVIQLQISDCSKTPALCVH